MNRAMKERSKVRHQLPKYIKSSILDQDKTSQNLSNFCHPECTFGDEEERQGKLARMFSRVFLPKLPEPAVDSPGFHS